MRAEKLNSDIRKEQIAEAALGVVATHGIKGLNMARVARRVGIVPSAIYRHFKGKAEVLDAVASLIENRLGENVRIVKEQTGDPLERLRLLLRLQVKFIRENQGVLRVVFSEDVYSDDPTRKARVYKMIRRYLDRVEEIVRVGQQEGVIRSDAAPNTLSMMFLGLIQPAAVLWSMSDGEFDVTKHTQKAWRIFSDAVGAAGGAAAEQAGSRSRGSQKGEQR